MLAKNVRAGHRFPSPRIEEGVVIAVCDFGRCDQDNRPDSVHVRGLTGDGRGNEWFIALIRDEELHVCNEHCVSDHHLLNRHHR